MNVIFILSFISMLLSSYLFSSNVQFEWHKIFTLNGRILFYERFDRIKHLKAKFTGSK